MLATFIIGLREGLEAALIVGIIAAFLRRQNRTDALRWMWIGVGVAITICVAVAVGLEILSQDLPQRQQEMLETVIGVVAVAMVTYMIVWMRRHARDLKGDLESAAAEAMDDGSAIAFAVMAFLAVLREGLETSVFLVAAFNSSQNALPSATGAVLGIAVSVALGYGIYRGGVRINLSRFFTVTGALLALVAAGLVMTALRTAHEAGWLDVGQQQVVDLTWLVRPGTVQASLITGVLGIPAKPVLIEVLGWAIYLVVVGTVVLWPASRPFPRRAVGLVTAALAGLSAIAALVTFLTAPAAPDGAGTRTLDAAITTAPQSSGILTGLTARAPEHVAVTLDSTTVDSTAAATGNAGSTATGSLTTDGVTTALPAMTGGATTPVGTIAAPTYHQVVVPDLPIEQIVPGAPQRVTLPQIAAANGGRLPVGLDPRKFGDTAPVIYAVSADVTVSVDPDFATPLATEVSYAVTATVTPASGAAAVLGKVATFTAAHQATAADLATVEDAKDQQQAHDSRTVTIPVTLLVLAALLAVASAILLWPRRRPDVPVDPGTPVPEPEPAVTERPLEKKENTR
ncbi:iron uptake transporter permease EfeU [Gordonia sp. NB41Y]|uniref:iron uptake transporter permease EfeU n=1 Tax=Gordonia sp. NB41Y TaxID=875808 RepID=UPI0009EC0A8A|nr:iron uptake transporter permease EfeU [Gordonia sp. NB41Y]WLP91743.1 iron uptake transporter permease EfeU [Gordonia sp. NB41Y]